MERYHFSYILAAKGLIASGASPDLVSRPVKDGIQKIGGALEEIAQCVPAPDYPILVAMLRATADAVEATMPPGGPELAKSIREGVQTVAVVQKVTRHSEGGTDNG